MHTAFGVKEDKDLNFLEDPTEFRDTVSMPESYLAWY